MHSNPSRIVWESTTSLSQGDNNNMQNQDIIMVNVTGTNGQTRNQKTISRQFNGLGQRLNDDGKVDGASPEALRNLPGGSGTAAPEFPSAAFAAAQSKTTSSDSSVKAQGLAEIKQIQLAFAQQITAWEKSLGGGNEKLQLAKSVLDYTKEFHGFREEDGNWFVIKLENLDVTTTKLNDGRTMYQVAGTAVFGNDR